MRITHATVTVDDQDKALRFYTEILGFVTKTDLPGGGHRWLTVVSPEGSPDFELLLEPNAHPAARIYQKALYDDGIPVTTFASADIEKEVAKLIGLGVEFRSMPIRSGPVTIALFDDTCGNLIQMYQLM